MRPLGGKTALVTGASRGIGRASALALAQAGAQVLVHYCSEDEAADEVVAAIRETGGHARKVAADLRAPEGPHQLARRVRLIIGARLDVLVASAGIVRDASLEDTCVADFDELFALNVRAPYFLLQQLMPALCKGSSVVLVSSRSVDADVGQRAAYAATAGAIEALVAHFAHSLGTRGVRVNAIARSATGRAGGNMAWADLPRRHGASFEGETDLRSARQADDVGAAVAFLASAAARWITGEVLTVEGR
ncbi:SDR family oxidoreductase [Paraburkholderia sp. DHOC27]|uniref:SDR family oxidoreductase n=1 Tax=Paraburkholderia sp. DHOC27 TaxID=2303330 RepID=UPI000E3D6B8B|nr:SDR family oxidoreductase [Paraburkholderia sp. DHOC27]RFU44806.1 SDR family oxidoreductase [Paraburkholderia sp. DHOC27]